MQITVVYPYQGRTQQQSAFQFFAIVHLYQHVEADFSSCRGQFLHADVIQSRHYQQYAIRADGFCLVNLVRIDDEILAQQRQAGYGLDLFQVPVGTLKKFFIGQHGKADSPGARIRFSDSGRIKIPADDALTGRCLFDFSNDRGSAVIYGATDRPIKPR